MNRSTTARLGFAGIAAFPLIVTVLHIVQAGDYHPLSQAVSELALGRGGGLMAVAFCALGTGTLLLALVLRRVDPRPRVAPWLIGASALPTYVSAFVHADGPGPTTTHGQIHQALGIVTFILMIAGMFSVVRAFRCDASWRPMSRPTLVWALAAVGGFLLIPIAGSAYFGLVQRIFLGVILSWALTVCARAGNAGAGAQVEDARADESRLIGGRA